VLQFADTSFACIEFTEEKQWFRIHDCEDITGEEFEVAGSGGTIIIDSNGVPIDFQDNGSKQGEAEETYGDIRRFNIHEYTNFYGFPKMDCADIVTIGYWTDTKYIAPHPKDREHWNTVFAPRDKADQLPKVEFNGKIRLALKTICNNQGT
jgi:hypothetical protein